MRDKRINTSYAPWGPRKLLCTLAGLASDSEVMVNLITAGSLFIKRVAGVDAAEHLTEKAVNALGLPMFNAGVTDNLHSYGLRLRMWNKRGPFELVKKRLPRVSPGPLKIGLVGEITYTGDKYFQESLAFPEEHELHVYATRAGKPFPPPGRANVTLARRPLCTDANATTPRRLKEQAFYEKAIRALAREINEAKLDMLVLAYFRHDELSDLACLVDTPCITAYLYGPRPTFHPKIDFCFFGQRHRAFPVVDKKHHSIFTGQALPSERCCPRGLPLYPDWSVDIRENPRLAEREPLILFHGGLAKLNSQPYLSLICDFLVNDPDLRFKFLGFGDYLGPILDTFSKRGLSSRVEFLGEVDKSLHETDAFGKTIIRFARRGRLEPDPWPHGGGASLAEAWWAGTPTVHMKMIPGDGDLPRPGQMRTDVPALNVPSATASSEEEYRELCRKCLYDLDFANRVVQEQYELAEKTVDAKRWWAEIIDAHDEWLTGTGWAAGEKPAGGRFG